MTLRDVPSCHATGRGHPDGRDFSTALTLAREDSTPRLARSLTQREQDRERRRAQNRRRFWARKAASASGDVRLEAVVGWDRLRADLAHTARFDPALAEQGWRLVAEAMQECHDDLTLLLSGPEEEPDSGEEVLW